MILKRIFDIIFSVFGLFILSPLLLLITIVSYFYLGGNPLFLQIRPGKDEVHFRLYKFRTMTNDTDSEGNLLPDEERITTWGLFLRSTSLDELPSLYNVLRGEMSLVGPRPLLVEYLPLYNESQKLRHTVKPGITGWAQINGRNAIAWNEKFELDIWYVNNHSMWLDLKILALSVARVVQRKGISASSHVTMDKFKGSHDEKV